MPGEPPPSVRQSAWAQARIGPDCSTPASTCFKFPVWVTRLVKGNPSHPVHHKEISTKLPYTLYTMAEGISVTELALRPFVTAHEEGSVPQTLWCPPPLSDQGRRHFIPALS